MTCRVFGAAEARAAGFLNDVVAAERARRRRRRLVAPLVGMPKLALLATKAHTNAVAESMVQHRPQLVRRRRAHLGVRRRGGASLGPATT